MNPSRRERIRALVRQIQQIESRRQPAGRVPITTGIAALDVLLPASGLRQGALVELVSAADGAGAWTLGVMMAARVCRERKMLVIVDAERRLYPPAAARLGLELDRSIVVRPSSRRDVYQAIVQSLRCPAVGAVFAWQERLSPREFRRLQLAAQTGGAVAILLRPPSAVRLRSCATARLLVSPSLECDDSSSLSFSNHLGSRFVCTSPADLKSKAMTSPRTPNQPSLRRLRVEVLRCSGRVCGQSLILEIDDETGHVRLPPGVAPATVVA